MSIRILSSELQKKAEKELNEVPKKIQDDLTHIKEWITKQPHLNVRQDDQWLLSFLRGCKFSLEKTKKKLDMYYSMRSMVPEFFSNRDPFLPEIQEVLKLGVYLPLPQTAQADSPRIVLIRCGNVDPYKIPFVHIAKTTLMIFDILLNEDDNFNIGGQIGWLNLSGMTLGHAITTTPTVVVKLIKCNEEAYPSRPKEIIFSNTPSYFTMIHNITKPILKSKILDRIHIYSDNNVENIKKSIPLSILPKEYGGDGISLDDLTAEWKRKVESYKDWFLDDAKYCSDETKRIGEPLNSDSVFGIAGSFRQLDFD